MHILILFSEVEPILEVQDEPWVYLEATKSLKCMHFGWKDVNKHFYFV